MQKATAIDPANWLTLRALQSTMDSPGPRSATLRGTPRDARCHGCFVAVVPPRFAPPRMCAMFRVFARQIAPALVVAAGMFCSGYEVARAQPSLSHLAPGALAPGKTTELTLHGSKLDGLLRVWTSFPAHVEIEAGDQKQK